ncbi:lipoprotein NlpD [Alteromonadaceae bacterium Bs31]|nr:lipoprotein NlpD [Alteromonadaceae bacterium Bs31]
MLEQFRCLFKILITVCGLACILVGCSSHSARVPVSDRNSPPGERLKLHTVAKGDTLYSIAWRYNLDYKQLARANGIGRDYYIYPGQKLRLDYTLSAVEPPKHQPPARKAPDKVTPAKPSKKAVKTVTSPPKARSIKTSSKAPQKPPSPPSNSPKSWLWPAKGKLVATFSSNGGLNKGIDIRGNLGEPVYAAAAGTVVYSGSGLRGYGKLLIVKHSDKYLSAYAHNRKLLVKEGSKVKAGDKIAEMGSSGTDTVKLHFEIRYDGNPVDPLRFLPRR